MNEINYWDYSSTAGYPNAGAADSVPGPEAKAAARKEAQERLEEKRQITIIASSIDELLKKIQDYEMEAWADQVRTEDEKAIGRTVDYKI
ncbi:hypothetical protein HNQ56_002575 [Anaerotaenia torta]|uniref:DUF6033 family protein n=1 Tax=Anaerotaenia torta TaxID=433293 RepID=UPI003D21484F